MIARLDGRQRGQPEDRECGGDRFASNREGGLMDEVRRD